MIVFGWRDVTYKGGEGQFFCPQCGGQQHYALMRVRSFFTLYFIPVIPLGVRGEYVECRTCDAAFPPVLLDLDAQAPVTDLAAEFEGLLLVVMVHMMLADGHAAGKEEETIRTAYARIIGRELDDGVLRDAIEGVGCDRGALHARLMRLAPCLTDMAKEAMLRAALAIAAADGEFQEAERGLLGEIAEALGMSIAHVYGVLAELGLPQRVPAASGLN